MTTVAFPLSASSMTILLSLLRFDTAAHSSFRMFDLGGFAYFIAFATAALAQSASVGSQDLEITCNTCNKSYIGETGRNAEIRAKECSIWGVLHTLLYLLLLLLLDLLPLVHKILKGHLQLALQ